MFKNLLAKFGHGSAKVDLVLDKQSFTLGESVSGSLMIQGGEVEQKINRIDIDFVVSIRKDGHEYKQVIQTFPFHHTFHIQPAERRTFPFSYTMPNNLLVSGTSVAYFFKTRLDIADGVDSSDRDFVHIDPPARLQQVIHAFQQLGFHEKYDSRSFDGYMQEFEFAPTNYFRDKVQEVEFKAAIEEGGVRLLLEVDLYSFFGEREIKREIWLTNEMLNQTSELVQYLNQVITEIVNDPSMYSQGYSGYFQHGQHGHRNHRYSHGHHRSHSSGGMGKTAMGAIGGFAAGMLAAEVMDEVLDGADDVAGGFDDFFGGDGEV
ncbi:sporulation protein [Thermoactinomyces sp. DSM 45892]|uniref:sporulation protein n=1 Tax=Thermoactinomyces sp. DSM 45892 TaxID=1882753 RepID=UPI000899894D|nr:sporulation protein [Thermoactinomyces sp. DSM 45892]SDZ14114.1 sporulation-control protein [Thermoactinomyces sp. DSM 45892]